ncbi:MAG: hypothetical protein ABI151_17355 [Chitinophagaceae bacterium]
MNIDFNFLLSLSVLFPFIVCLYRFKTMNKNYRPFAILMFASLFTELISNYLAVKYKTNLAFLNFFSLFESCVWVYQFHRWGFWQKKSGQRFKMLLVLMFMAWALDNFILSNIGSSNRYYLLTYYFGLVMLSIRQINQDMMNGKRAMDESGRLIICTGILLFFTFGIVRESFTIFEEGLSRPAKFKISLIISIANLIANIIYGFGACYIPKQKNWPDFFNTFAKKVE